MAKKIRINDKKGKNKVKKKIKPNKPKEKKKAKKKNEFGQGNNQGNVNTRGGNNPKEIIGIKDLEKSVLEYIIGQDEQVRQIITAIYR